MNLLLDTHAFLWFMEGSERISQRARDGIEAAGGVRALSVASAWELAIKTSLGKLALAKPLGELLPPLLFGGRRNRTARYRDRGRRAGRNAAVSPSRSL